VLYSGTNLQSRTTECCSDSRWALPCIYLLWLLYGTETKNKEKKQ